MRTGRCPEMRCVRQREILAGDRRVDRPSLQSPEATPKRFNACCEAVDGAVVDDGADLRLSGDHAIVDALSQYFTSAPSQ
jgi:hypothetical protein